MADRRISKRVQKEIREALQSRSASKEALDQTLADTVQSFQESASARAASQFANAEYSRIVRSRAAEASALARRTMREDSSYADRYAAMQRFSGGLGSFAGPRTQELISQIHTSFDQAESLSRQMMAGNIPSEIKTSAAQRILSEFPGFVNQTRLIQAQEINRRHQETRLREEYRQVQLIQDPTTRMTALRDLERESSGIITPGSRLASDIIQGRRRTEQEMARQADIQQSFGIREQVRAAGGPVQALNVLEKLRQEDPGARSLKEIERLTKEQNALIKRDVDNLEDAQKKFPVLASILAGGGGNQFFGGGPLGPGGPAGMSPEQLARFNRAANFTMLAGQGISTAAMLGSAYLDSVARVQEKTFLTGASADTIRARFNQEMLFGTSGESIMKQFGDILGGPKFARFMGVSGIENARRQAAISMQEQRGVEARGGLFASVGFAGGLMGLAAAGAGMVAAPLVAPVALAGLTAMAVSGSSLFQNRALRETGIFGSEARKEAQEQRRLDFESTRSRLTQADLDRNLFLSNAIQNAQELRQAEMSALSMAGGLSPSFRAAVSGRFANALRRAGRTRLDDPQMQVAAGSLRQDTLIDRAIDLGLDPSALTLATARAEMFSDPRSRMDPTRTAMRLRELEIAGRGSVEQNLTNLARLNRISGSADSRKELEDTLSVAFQRGFKGARLSQEFADAVFEGMSKTQSIDREGIQTRIGQVSALFGGGERGLSFARDSLAALDRFGQNTIVDVGAKIRTSQALGGLKTEFRGPLQDVLGEMSMSQRLQTLIDIRSAFEKPGNVSRLAPQTREAFEYLRLGGGNAQTVQDLIKAQAGPGIQQAAERLRTLVQNRGNIRAGDVAGLLAESSTGIAGLAGFSLPALAQILSATGELDPNISRALGAFGRTEADAEQRKAVQRFIDLNQPVARAARARASSAGMGEDIFSRSIMTDLTAAMARQPLGGSRATLRSIAEAANVNLSSLTNLRPEQLARFAEDPRFTKALLTPFGDMGSLVPEGTRKEDIEQLTKIRSALQQSRGEVMASSVSQEAAALGIQGVTMTQLTSDTIERIGLAVGNAVGRVNLSSEIAGNMPPPNTSK